MSTAAQIELRPARTSDLPGIVRLYNHYIEHTPVTFDLEPTSVERRTSWMAQFAEQGRHRLFVAVRDGALVGYAGSHRFRDKAAYDTTVETTIYLAQDATGAGLGARLYGRLFEALAGEDVRSCIAGITLPNPASIALHERFGFVRCGVMHQVGTKHGRAWDVAWYERFGPPR